MRKKVVCFVIYIFIYTTVFSVGVPRDVNAQPMPQWEKTFGGPLYDSARHILKTTDGNYLLVGTSGYDGVHGDIWLIKTDTLGNEIWNKSFDRSSLDKGFSAQETSDEGYIITGYTESYYSSDKDCWLIKTDGLGNEQWSKTFGGIADDWGMSVKVTSDNGFIIAGWTRSYGSGGEDMWLIKTDSLGDEQWNKTFGGSPDDQGHSVQITSDGGYILSGNTKSYGMGS